MKQNIRTAQAGYAMILMVLALMGIGGVVLAGFTQGVKVESEHERYLHNQRVLREAKQALLQYAYNYPQLGPDQNDGPGRLLCPDTDNDDDGLEEYVANCGGNIVGRFPWGDPDLNFFDARDASGERLWYAVSPNFGRGPGSVINSASFGGITVEDRSGAMLHDGTATIPAGGVAAVIIAPGAPIARNGVMQVRGTADEKTDAVNYLDLFGARDNAVFVNGDPNGFVTGPIEDVVTGDLLVNDQMIVVTAAEIIAMAEKATLQAYRESINAYLDSAGSCTGAGANRDLCEAGGGTWNPVYPWLYNYEGIEYNPGAPEPVDVAIDKLSSYFPVGGCDDSLTYLPDPPSWHTQADCVANGGTWDAGFDSEMEDYLGRDVAGDDDGIFGRIPSIFAEYFTETDSQPIETQLSGSITLSASALTTLSEGGGFPGSGNQSFNDGPTLSFDPTQILTDVKFVDLANSGEGRLTTTFPKAEPQLIYHVYFWDEDNADRQGWTTCPGGADQLSDCVGVSTEGKARILHMTVTLKFEDPGGIENFDMDYTPAPAIAITPATATAHASITATYAASEVISFPGTISVTYEFEQHFHYSDSGENLTTLNSGDGSYAAGTVDMTGFTLGPLSLGIRYYPELPGWAFTNGWHDSIRMAYALEYKPPGTGHCIVDDTCLHLEDSSGAPQNAISLLVIAGQHDWQDVGTTGKLRNSLLSVFDEGNQNTNPTFYRHRGNDEILVIDKLP